MNRLCTNPRPKKIFLIKWYLNLIFLHSNIFDYFGMIIFMFLSQLHIITRLFCFNVVWAKKLQQIFIKQDSFRSFLAHFPFNFLYVVLDFYFLQTPKTKFKTMSSSLCWYIADLTLPCHFKNYLWKLEWGWDDTEFW